MPFFILRTFDCPVLIETFVKAVRGHWGIENSLHWTLDVIFNEDASRTRKDHSAQNMSLIRKLSFNTLKQFRVIPVNRGGTGKTLSFNTLKQFPLKKSVNMKRKKCKYDIDFITEVLRSI